VSDVANKLKTQEELKEISQVIKENRVSIKEDKDM
jgi:hypothetical protein